LNRLVLGHRPPIDEHGNLVRGKADFSEEIRVGGSLHLELVFVIANDLKRDSHRPVYIG
jgi:hypothetical protein